MGNYVDNIYDCVNYIGDHNDLVDPIDYTSNKFVHPDLDERGCSLVHPRLD